MALSRLLRQVEPTTIIPYSKQSRTCLDYEAYSHPMRASVADIRKRLLNHCTSAIDNTPGQL